MSVKSKEIQQPRAYLLMGDDEFRKQRKLDELLKKLVAPDFADFDLEHIEGDSATAEKIISGLMVPPFSSSQRVVLVKYANKMAPPEQEKLASSLAKVPSSGCLVLVNPAPEKVDGRPRKGSEVIGELSRAVRKVGQVLRIGDEKGREKTENARQFVKSLFESAGKKIDSTAIATLLQRVGSDFAILNTEVIKLINYSGDNERITSDDIIKVTSETPEEKIFKLLDAISARNASQGLKFLDELFEVSDDPKADAPKTLANIARQLRLLWQAKMLMSAGVSEFRKDSVPDHLRSNLPSSPNVLDTVGRQAWMADRLKRQAQAFSRDDLLRCFGSVSRADMMLKSIDGDVEDPRMVMELLVLELARARR